MKLLHGNCLKLMKNIPDKSIDMILCDLPYGVTAAKWDSVIPLNLLWKQYKRIIKDHGCIALFGAEPFSSNLRISNLKMYRYDWIWHKTEPTCFLQAHKMPLHAYENIMIFYKHLPKYNPQMSNGKPYSWKNGHKRDPKRQSGAFNRNTIKRINYSHVTTRFPTNVITFKAEHGKYHPTQKPVHLLEYLIKTYTNKHDLVLDNCMGSGSTGVACKLLNRRFVGMEITNKYYQIAKKRIHNVKSEQESLL